MKIKRFVVGPFATNSYHLSFPSGTNILIDPASSERDFIKQVEELGCDFVLLTHGHIDHIKGLEKIDSPVYLFGREREIFLNNEYNLANFLGQSFNPKPNGLHLLEEGNQTLKDIAFQVFHTPGHTPGSCCYLFEGGVLFSGDTLFKESVGRTDFAYSSGEEIISSISKKLFVLPEDVVVFPGHGPQTTIGEEKENNPFLYGKVY